MATKRLTIDGYGQIEINNCAFRRDGRIEAQYKADATDFATAPVENGMLLEVDGLSKTVKFTNDSANPIALVYSAEHNYDETKLGLKDFYLKGADDFLPRLGYLSVGDKFTTNCICYDSAVDTAWAQETSFVAALASYATNPLYGGKSGDGSILVSETAPSDGPKLRVIRKTTMPDGSLGVKFQVVSA